ncbi:MAG: NAD(P)/FAD-dependent oxidoreductase [Synoicihabitans sp.]
MNRVVIVGAGAAGLVCALRLQERGISSVVLEASNGVGGRIRTDELQGFQLDRGFQVMLSAYPACRRYLDYEKLELKPFDPGAVVHTEQGWQRVVDPRRRWSEIWPTLRSDVGTFSDKLNVLKWALRARAANEEFPFDSKEGTSLSRLRQRGFSEQMIDRFWRPWLSGIFLESELATSARMLEFVFGMFARGNAVIPSRGMQAIPEQLASRLTEGTIELGQRVAAIEAKGVILQDGKRVSGDAVVVATDASSAQQLGIEANVVSWRESRCIYYAADKAPVQDALLRLNGTSSGVVNHLAVLDRVNPACAPEGRSLIMAAIRPGDTRPNDIVEHESGEQMAHWFGRQTQSWRILRHDRIKQALPSRTPLSPQVVQSPEMKTFRCGDYLRHPSLQGAMESGEMAADAVADSLTRQS